MYITLFANCNSQFACRLGFPYIRLFLFLNLRIGHVKNYPTIHYFGNPGHTQSMIASMTLLTEYFFGNSSIKGCIVGMLLTRPIQLGKHFTV